MGERKNSASQTQGREGGPCLSNCWAGVLLIAGIGYTQMTEFGSGRLPTIYGYGKLGCYWVGDRNLRQWDPVQRSR